MNVTTLTAADGEKVMTAFPNLTADPISPPEDVDQDLENEAQDPANPAHEVLEVVDQVRDVVVSNVVVDKEVAEVDLFPELTGSANRCRTRVRDVDKTSTTAAVEVTPARTSD